MKSILPALRGFLTLFFCLLSVCLLKAQDFPFGVFDQATMKMSSYSNDTNAVAVVLHEFGKARISNSDANKLILEYHVKIKVFNSQKFTHGDVVIPLHKENKENFETVRNIKGVVFYQDENGSIRQTELEKKSIFNENASMYLDLVKFAMPNIRDGCIIEYSYELESPFIFNFRSWEFQWDIPKIYSEYVAIIPGVYNYNVSLIGPYKLSKNDAVIVKDCFQPGGGVKADCSKMTYGMNDIPAFIEEDFMTAPKNFISAINFELSEVALPSGGKRKITKDWKDIDYELKKHFNFGKQVKKDELFKEPLPPILKGKPNDLERAQAVYNYIKGLYKWNNYYGKYSDNGIKKSLESRSGNVGDINLSLVAALNAAGLNADAVILSTRDNGLINKLYPIMSDFNYVIAMVAIDGKNYFLDATEPLMPFGLLPLRCINDQGRVMCIDKPSYWIDLAASQKRSKVYSVQLTLQSDGIIKGLVKNYSMGYEAYNKRKRIKQFNTVEEYVEDMDERMAKIKIISHDIQSLDSLENTLGEVYEIEMEAFDDLNKDRFYFNPFFMDRMDENPFKLAERSYPVDWGAPSDSRVVINMSFPENYEIISRPEDKGIALPNKGGRFISNINISDNKLQFSESMQLEKSIYNSEEYHYLKELYNQIIQFQKTDIIFKKKL